MPLRFKPPPPPAAGPTLVVLPGRVPQFGGGTIRRVLPHPKRRLIGAWCFADHFGPTPSGGPTGGVGPHPHIGLQTVTWLISGQTRHRDSLGTNQLIRAGEVNWMTAGHGICHAEDGENSSGDVVHGVQLWVALPEHARHGPPQFEHHTPPTGLVDGAVATVIAGTFAGLHIPATVHSPLVGVDLVLTDGRAHTLPLDPTFEHGLMVLSGAATVEDCKVSPGSLLDLGRRRSSLNIRGEDGARVMLLGGAPLDEPVAMWWNFVFRTADEAAEAARGWNAHSPRFGTVEGSPSPWIGAPDFPA